MFKLIFMLLLLFAFVAAILMARQPATFRYARTLTMNAGPAKIYEQVIDFRKWNDWSPWAKLDPSALVTFSGAESGVGSEFAWEGNNKVGAGKMTIIDAKPHEFIKIQLEFFKPFKAVNIAEFTFTPEGPQTVVTWSVHGPNTLPGRFMQIFINCEKMIGNMYSQGLANIKAIVEK